MKEYPIPTLLEFGEFYQAARLLMPASIHAVKLSVGHPLIEQHKISTDHIEQFDRAPNLKLRAKISKVMVTDLKEHVVFRYLVRDVYFQKALKKFETHRYYRNNSQSGIDEDTFRDCIVLFLMCHNIFECR